MIKEKVVLLECQQCGAVKENYFDLNEIKPEKIFCFNQLQVDSSKLTRYQQYLQKQNNAETLLCQSTKMSVVPNSQIYTDFYELTIVMETEGIIGM